MNGKDYLETVRFEGLALLEQVYYAYDIIKAFEAGQVNAQSGNRPTGIKDRNGNMICFGDTVRFANKFEWYKNQYLGKVALGSMTREDALKEIESKPYEERLVKSVQDYEWLLSNEIQKYWEIYNS